MRFQFLELRAAGGGWWQLCLNVLVFGIDVVLFGGAAMVGV